MNRIFRQLVPVSLWMLSDTFALLNPAFSAQLLLFLTPSVLIPGHIFGMRCALDFCPALLLLHCPNSLCVKVPSCTSNERALLPVGGTAMIFELNLCYLELWNH